ncbi:MAG TPA: tetratricopeptide repeat protein [Verrucomicrobiae bacterium]|nr:tetratricopeptide repeat protein [Verrucomicrobiae bacterium]
MREMTVGVAVTPSFKATPDWKGTFKKRLKYASSIFEREFRIKLKEAVFFDWDPPAEAADMSLLLDDLMARYTLGSKKTDMMIGLTRLDDISGSMNLKDLHVLGKTRPFSGFMVLRYPNHPLFRVQEETILVHEMGHLFGAVHTSREDTIMCSYVDRQIPTTFDKKNHDIVSAIRNMNFQRGMESLDPGIIQQLLDTYMDMNSGAQSTDFYYALANFYLQLGQYAEAANALERLVKMEPDNGRAFYNLGVLYLNMGKSDAAEKNLTAAIARLGSAGQQVPKAKAYDALAKIYFRQGNMEGAGYAWTKALALDPDNLDIKVGLAIVQLKSGQVAAAENALQKALKESPNNAQILTHLGTASYMKGDSAGSLQYYQKALKIIQDRKAGGKKDLEDDTLLVDIYGGMGMGLWAAGNREEATKYFSAACAMNPSLVCHQKMGQIFFEIGEWDAAISEFVQVLQQDKEDAETYGILGMALVKKNELEKAVSVFQEGLRYVKDSKKSSRLHSNSGHLYLQLQRADLAVTEFMSAISEDWSNKDAHMGIALAYISKGEPVSARQALQNLLGMDPQNGKAKELLVQVDKMIQELQNQQVSVSFSEGG